MCDCYPYALDLGHILYYWVFSSETNRKDTSFHLPWRPTLPQLCLHTEHSSTISHFSSSDLRVKTASVKNHTKPVPTHPSAVSVPLFGRLRKTPALHHQYISTSPAYATTEPDGREGQTVSMAARRAAPRTPAPLPGNPVHTPYPK